MNQAPGEFPWLEADDHFEFPHGSFADEEGILAVGGNLSPGMLLSAYRQGIFPWFSPGDPIIWWCPNPRFVIKLADLHVSRSLNKTLKSGRFTVTVDRAFSEVVHACATAPRAGQAGTWITEDMELGYRRLHELGYAHSCESWFEGRLAGGIYGVSIGRMFFGESMFSRETDASKVALVRFGRALQTQGFDVIDAQLHTPHVESMGGRPIPREDFLSMVADRISHSGNPVPWHRLMSESAST